MFFLSAISSTCHVTTHLIGNFTTVAECVPETGRRVVWSTLRTAKIIKCRVSSLSFVSSLVSCGLCNIVIVHVSGATGADVMFILPVGSANLVIVEPTATYNNIGEFKFIQLKCIKYAIVTGC